MTISNTDNKNIYVGDDATLIFAYTFKIFADEDMSVVISDTSVTPQVDTTLTLNQDYTVSDAGNPTGGDVTLIIGGASVLTAAPTTTDDVTIKRDLDITQETDYVENDPFPAESHEDALDRLTMIAQQLDERASRSVNIPSNVTGVSVDLPSPIADFMLGWDSLGTSLVNIDPNVVGAASAAAAAASAAAALVSENAAAASEAAASTSETNSGLNVGYAQEWAITVEDTPVSIAAGGDGATTFSALHWAAKSASSAAALGLPTPVFPANEGQVLVARAAAVAPDTYLFEAQGVATVVDDFTIINDTGAIEVAPFIVDNIMLNALQIAENNDLTAGSMIDGYRDSFFDESGINGGASSGQLFEGGSYRTPTVTFSEDTKLLLNFDGYEGALEILDNSGNDHVITQVGNASQIANHYKFGTSAAHLNGLTQYFTVADHADFAFGSTGDFNIDLWFKVDSLTGTASYFVHKRTAGVKELEFAINGTNRLLLTTSDGTPLSCVSAQQISDNDWHHVEGLRITNGTELSIYLDGYQIAYATGTAQSVTSTDPLRIGNNQAGTGLFGGYLDDFRITDNNVFTASPIPQPYLHLTMDDDANSSAVIDYGSAGINGVSANNTDTIHSDGQVNYSLGFNGTTQRITANGAATQIQADATGSVMMWVKRNVLGTQQTVFSISTTANNLDLGYMFFDVSNNFNFLITDTANVIYIQTTAPAVADNNWHQVAVTQDGVAAKIYIDGVDIAYTTLSGTGTEWFNGITSSIMTRVHVGAVETSGGISQYFSGNVDDFRYYSNAALTQTQIQSIRSAGLQGIYGLGTEITVPTAAHVSDANTKLLCHFDSGSQNDLVDSSGSAHTVTAVNDASVTSPYDNAFVDFDGTGDYLSIPTSTDFDVFNDLVSSKTIGFWCKLRTPTAQHILLNHVTDGLNYWHISSIGGGLIQIVFTGSGNPTITGTTNIQDGLWHYVSVSKVVADVGLYIDGSQDAFGTLVSGISHTANFYIGAFNGTAPFANADMGDIHINTANLFAATPVIGLTDAITVPTTSTVADVNTVLLIQGTQDESLSNRIPTFNNGAVLKENTDSGITGSVSSLSLTESDQESIWIADDPVFSLGTTINFTIDCWIKVKNTGAQQYIFNKRTSSANNEWDLIINDTSGGLIQLTLADGINLVAIGTTDVRDNVWHHIMGTRINSGTEIAVYVDGQQEGYATGVIQDITSTGRIDIGRNTGAANFWVDGFIDEFRITNANSFGATPVVGLTDTITVPTGQHASDGTTLLLLHFNCGAQLDLTDSSPSGHIVNSVNGAGVSGRFGTARLFLDGADDEITLTRSEPLQFFETTRGTKIVHMWVRERSIAVLASTFMSQNVDINNFWQWYMSGNQMHIRLNIGGVNQFTAASGVTINDTLWHHIVMAVVDDVVAGYIDGNQVSYATFTGAYSSTFNAPIRIGRNGLLDEFLGEIDGVEIKEQNIFGMAPNIGVTDTYTIPTVKPALSATSGVMTLVTNAETAQAGNPSNIKVYVDLEDIDPTVLLNTDIVVSVSRDGGTTFTAATLVNQGQLTNGRRLIVDTVDVSAQPISDQVVTKIETFNDVQMRAHSVSNLWD